MKITRRSFLGGSVAAAVVPSLRARAASAAELDGNLAVFFSDIHCHGKTRGWLQHQHAILKRYVDEVLAMRPLPAHAVIFGDFSASVGWVEDFRRAREILKPLAEAGVKFTFGMGNHDKRKNFLAVFPEYADRLLVKDRIVSKFSTPHADFIMLDSLRERPGEEGNHVDGRVDGEQLEWLRRELAAARRPLFVGAHHAAGEAGIRREIVQAPFVYGYVFGHEHAWNDQYLHDGSYGNSQTVQTATLPSSGFYGDLGYALFRTFEDRAELTLHQDDFFFNREWTNRPRPKNWQARIEAHKNRKVVFWYDKPGNFYKG